MQTVEFSGFGFCLERPGQDMTGHQMFVQLILDLVICSAAAALISNTCSPTNQTAPLLCTGQQWIQIESVRYLPQKNSSDVCQLDVASSCSFYLHDENLNANCNGPVNQSCAVVVNVEDAKTETSCLKEYSGVGASVTYSCINSSVVVDVCKDSVNLTPGTHFYLASPMFPNSKADNRVCNCSLQGSPIKMTAVQISVQSTLPWPEDDQYSSVFAVLSDSRQVWRSRDYTDISHIKLFNTNMFLPMDPPLYVRYSSYGLEDQNVWIHIVGQGQLQISCTSLLLPPDKILPKPSVGATTEATLKTFLPSLAADLTSTKEAITRPTADTITSPTADTITSPRVEATNTTTNEVITGPLTTKTIIKATTSALETKLDQSTEFQAVESSPIVSRTTDSSKQTGTQQTIDKNSKSEPAVLILAGILAVLVIIALLVAFIIYRKRRKFTYNGKSGLYALFLSLYHQLRGKNNQDGDGQDCTIFHESFDGIFHQTENGQQVTVDIRTTVQDTDMDKMSRAAVQDTDMDKMSRATVQDTDMDKMSRATVQDTDMDKMSRATVQEKHMDKMSRATVQDTDMDKMSRATVQETDMDKMSRATVQDTDMDKMSRATAGRQDTDLEKSEPNKNCSLNQSRQMAGSEKVNYTLFNSGKKPLKKNTETNQLIMETPEIFRPPAVEGGNYKITDELQQPTHANVRNNQVSSTQVNNQVSSIHAQMETKKYSHHKKSKYQPKSKLQEEGKHTTDFTQLSITPLINEGLMEMSLIKEKHLNSRGHDSAKTSYDTVQKGHDPAKKGHHSTQKVPHAAYRGHNSTNTANDSVTAAQIHNKKNDDPASKGSGPKFEAQEYSTTVSKQRKVSRPEFVASIIQLSLQDMKQRMGELYSMEGEQENVDMMVPTSQC
ncbi:uncharacterized protein LOC131926908 [Physella acuta]|uniref:uncharacterized protein LOC131926908 n=1 Tax=Physella acuta TaxID=109671 RepID=UPI0027DB5B52|nr:uncharacterized protein LOC131926908 [Physella acuta]